MATTMMLTLGLFVFMLDTLPYQQLQRQMAWRHASNSRVGTTPASQFLGRDADKVTIEGVLLPELTGGTLSLALLEAMADEGTAWPLIEGTGTLYGMFVVENLSQTKTVFFQDGAARKIEFQLGLKRVDENHIDLYGTISRQLLGMAGL